MKARKTETIVIDVDTNESEEKVSEDVEIDVVNRMMTAPSRRFTMVAHNTGLYHLHFNPLSPTFKLQILFSCLHTLITEVVGRICEISREFNLSDNVLSSHNLSKQ